MSEQGAGQILIEYAKIGNQVRVAAIDVRTGIEVIAIAPVTATKLQMERLAVAKLKRRLARDD